MKQKLVLAAGILLFLLPIIYIVNAQIETRRRTPRLTTDDVTRSKTPTTVVSEPGDARSQPSTRGSDIEPASGVISWQRSLRQAMSEARSEGKLIVVDVYTDWCGWCKKMDQNIYSDPLVVGLSKREVFLKFDAEDGGEGQEFAKEMRVRGYPTTIILDEDGRRVASQSGYFQTPGSFVAFVEKARRDN